jgi:hypothetical protein
MRTIFFAALVVALASCAGAKKGSVSNESLVAQNSNSQPTSKPVEPKSTPSTDNQPTTLSSSDNHKEEPKTTPATAIKEEEPEPIVVVYLMYRFEAALSTKPTNTQPATKWKVLLAKPSNTITCKDCHGSLADMMTSMFSASPPAGTALWEKDTVFMTQLMESWVKSANSTATVRAKLKADLSCASCHEKTSW